MKVAITGGHGFLGWHVACRLRAVHGVEPIRLGRADFHDAQRLRDQLGGVDTILHLAGVNRAASEREVEAGNMALADSLGSAIREAASPVHVVFANSIHSRLDNAYGRGKSLAAEQLGQAVAAVRGTFADVLLPNLFGEHGRPSYNSFVATFAYEISRGREPAVTQDRRIPLLHAQDAAASLIDAALARRSGEVEPAGECHKITEVLGLLKEFHQLYQTGEIPDLSAKFAVDLFNTYRSFTFPQQFPITPPAHSDGRGALFEAARSHGGTGQVFVSTTVPGATRGNHYHLHKVERFFVVKGEAEVKLRRVLHDDVVTFLLSGDRPAFVDMPTMWVHSIKNVGSSELITMFWADQLLNPESPDQYPEMVEVEETAR